MWCPCSMQWPVWWGVPYGTSEPPAPTRPGNLLVNPGSLAQAIHPESETQGLEACSLFLKSSPSSEHSGRPVACRLVECTFSFLGEFPFWSLLKYGLLILPTEGDSGGFGRVQESLFCFWWKSLLCFPFIPLDCPVAIWVDYNSLFLFGIFKEFGLQII